jgi:excisionase family DNA binding protein
MMLHRTNMDIEPAAQATSDEGQVATTPPAEPLTPKEFLIVSCVTRGMKSRDIASQLGTTEQVIKNYLRSVYDKLGVSSRVELAIYCLHSQALSPPAPAPSPSKRVLETKVESRAKPTAVPSVKPANRASTFAREVMNIRQAAQYLGVSTDTLYKYVGQGKVPAFRLGNRWRFKKSMLDAWMEEKCGRAKKA